MSRAQQNKISFIFLAGLFSFQLLAAPKPSEPKYVKVGKIKPLTVKAGSKGEAVVPIEIEQGYHIQANIVSAEGLIPTVLKMLPNEAIEPMTALYPEGVKLKALGQEINSFVGKVEFKLPVKVLTTAKKGKVDLQAELKYQACSEKTCYFPMTITVPVPVTIQ